MEGNSWGLQGMSWVSGQHRAREDAREEAGGAGVPGISPRGCSLGRKAAEPQRLDETAVLPFLFLMRVWGWRP